MRKIELNIKPGVRFRVKGYSEASSLSRDFITELEVIHDNGDIVFCCDPNDLKLGNIPFLKSILLSRFEVM